MIGPKKLSTIRQQLKSALAATGDDPVRWLEARMTTPAGQAAAGNEGNEVLRSLQGFLERDGSSKRRTRRVVAIK